MLVRHLWDVGLAHRDIKPANLLVRDGQLHMIDVAFLQVRPSPWRQAVDLANMMLVLAVRTDAPRVYERALQYFTPDEVAEAFAATRGVASPTQLRMVMKCDGRDLMAQFRTLAPERRAISLQRWSVRRVLLALALLGAAALVLPQAFIMLSPAHDIGVPGAPFCGTDNLMVLMAQSVPTAPSVPCISSLSAGWTLGGVQVQRRRGRFWLDSDTAGRHALEVALLPVEACPPTAGATEVPSDQLGMRRYELPDRLPPQLQTTRLYLLPGGCVTYKFAFKDDVDVGFVFDADAAVGFQPRDRLVDKVRERSGLRLCGVGAPCPGGS
jgi:hypothetical protein